MFQFEADLYQAEEVFSNFSCDVDIEGQIVPRDVTFSIFGFSASRLRVFVLVCISVRFLIVVFGRLRRLPVDLRIFYSLLLMLSGRFLMIDGHTSGFKHHSQKDATTLTQYIWKLKEMNIAYSLKWKIVAQSRPYSNISKICNLCLTEKYFIIFRHYMASLNIRNGLASSCRHNKKSLLANYKQL